MKLFIREISDGVCFFRMLKRRPKAVVFYSEGRAFFKYFEGLIEEILNNTDWAVFYVTSDAGDRGYPMTEGRFHVFYANRLLPFWLPFVNAKALLMTMTELNRHHMRRSIYPTKHIYLFHALVSTHMQYRLGSFDGYDTVFCAGAYHAEEIKKTEQLYGLPAKTLLEVGYPLLEKIHQDHQSFFQNQRACAGAKTVLIAPSWAPGNIMDSCLESLVEILSRSGYQLTLRPHPEFQKRRRETIKRLRMKYRNRQGIVFEEDLASGISLHKAEVLITDWSGIAFEYAWGTERPVVYIDTPRKVVNPEYLKIGIEPMEVKLRQRLGKTVSLDALPSLPEVLEALNQQRAHYRDEIISMREEYISNFGNSAKIGVDYLRGLYAGEN